jgi:dolichol kinase
MSPKSWKVDSQWHVKLMMEVRRKLIHLSGLSVPLGILVFGKIYTAAMIALALTVALVLEAGRLKGMVYLPAVRDHEQEKVAGYIYYIFGSLVTVAIFSPMIAITAMLMLSLGDAVSGLVGSVLENSNVRGCNQRWRIKPFPIVTAMFMACLAIGYLSSAITDLPFQVYLAGAVGATMADSIALVFCNRGLDDNLTIPIFAGVMMSLAVLVG